MPRLSIFPLGTTPVNEARAYLVEIFTNTDDLIRHINNPGSNWGDIERLTTTSVPPHDTRSWYNLMKCCTSPPELSFVSSHDTNVTIRMSGAGELDYDSDFSTLPIDASVAFKITCPKIAGGKAVSLYDTLLLIGTRDSTTREVKLTKYKNLSIVDGFTQTLSKIPADVTLFSARGISASGSGRPSRTVSAAGIEPKALPTSPLVDVTVMPFSPEETDYRDGMHGPISGAPVAERAVYGASIGSSSPYNARRGSAASLPPAGGRYVVSHLVTVAPRTSGWVGASATNTTIGRGFISDGRASGYSTTPAARGTGETTAEITFYRYDDPKAVELMKALDEKTLAALLLTNQGSITYRGMYKPCAPCHPALANLICEFYYYKDSSAEAAGKSFSVELPKFLGYLKAALADIRTRSALYKFELLSIMYLFTNKFLGRRFVGDEEEIIQDEILEQFADKYESGPSTENLYIPHNIRKVDGAPIGSTYVIGFNAAKPSGSLLAPDLNFLNKIINIANEERGEGEEIEPYKTTEILLREASEILSRSSQDIVIRGAVAAELGRRASTTAAGAGGPPGGAQ